MHESRKQRLAEFAEWVNRHIKGDEKGEAHIFLDRLFRGFGQKGILEAGGQAEFRIKKAEEDGGGTSFADCVWKPHVLIEMKKRGEDLQRHYRQAFGYWERLVPGRPRYVVLCNFDEFWVYDFDNQMDIPVDKVTVSELSERYGPLAFLFPTNEKPTFGNHHVAVTREAADLLARCFGKLIVRKIERDVAQRFILQMLVALFAEDIDLLEKYTVVQLLDECKSPRDSYDLLGALFVEMNTPGRTPGGRFKGVDYFNGGLFAKPARVELYSDELAQLKKAAEANWSKVRPEIFGTLFEHSCGDIEGERHAFGIHFTSPVDIMKIVGPTIVEPWREQIEKAKTIKRLGELLQRLQHFIVLDPACGSGNFLYIAYRELKRLEATLIERINEMSSRAVPSQAVFGFVTARQFYGMDINPFAVELAKVTMMIARKLAIDELHVTEPALPLDNLDTNFVAADALIDSLGNPTPWPKADVIISNPPFLGAKLLKPERGADYVNLVRRAYPDVPGMADYCVYWFRKAHDHLAECTAADPVAGRAGLVGTQNIRNNQSRVGGLDYIVKTGTIIEAVDNQPWSGEANVHVAIVNWLKLPDNEGKAENERAEPPVLPKTRRLWLKVQPAAGRKRAQRRGSGPATKEYELDYRETHQINSALSDQTDVSSAKPLMCNTAPQRCFNGQMLGHQGFLLSADQRDAILKKDQKSGEVIHPYLNGLDAVTGSSLDRFVLDFEQMNQIEAAGYAGAFDWVRANVLADRERKAKEGVDKEGKLRPHHKAFLARWWQLSFGRPEMLSVIKPLPRYLTCAYVTKRPIFMFIASAIRPSNLIQVFGFADDYSFGILQSHAHWLWFVTKCGKLTERFRYSAESVFDTFPWPQSPNAKQIQAVAKAGQKVRQVRAEALTKMTGGLRAVYRTLEFPGDNPLKDAHAALDAAVLDAYGFSPKKDLLTQLLALNLEVAKRLDASQPVTAPGVPANYSDPSRLVTDDCIRGD